LEATGPEGGRRVKGIVEGGCGDEIEEGKAKCCEKKRKEKTRIRINLNGQSFLITDENNVTSS